MNSDRFQRCEELFHATLGVPEEERGAFLRQRCGHDPLLQADVERLLAAHARAGDFILSPAIAAGGNASGSPKDLMIEIVSTPGLFKGPRTSVMTPSPRSSGVGNRIMSRTTLSPGLAPLAPGSPTRTEWAKSVPSTRTWASPSRSK